jgi:hypothetical protein
MGSTPAYLASPAALAVKLSRGSWTPAPHLRLLNRALVRLAGRHIDRLVIAMPPRHGKSEFVSHWLPVWWLSLWAQQRVILASYEADFASTWGRAARNSIEANPDLLPRGSWLAGDSSAAHRWNTRDGGGMTTAGVGGPITGKGADLFIVDDPYKGREDADSLIMRRRIWNWWQAVVATRLEPGGVVVLIQTRWHEDDLAGRLIADGWPAIRLPATADGLDPLGREWEAGDALDRELGEALWPDRYDLDALIAKRQEVGDYVYSALYQGLPTPTEGGGLWQREDHREAFRRWIDWGEPDGERCANICVAVDPPGGRTECGIMVCGEIARDRAAAVPSRGLVLEDATVAAKEPWGEAAINAYHRHHADVIVAESNYGGEMVEQVIHAADPTVPVVLIHASRGKRVRAEPVHELYRQERIAHVARFPDLENECVRWEPDCGMESPNRMDAMCWGFIHLGLASPETFAESLSLRERGREPVVVRGDMVLRGRQYVDRSPS